MVSGPPKHHIALGRAFSRRALGIILTYPSVMVPQPIQYRQSTAYISRDLITDLKDKNGSPTVSGGS